MNHKPDKIIWIREFLVTQLNHWLLFPVYVTLVTIFSSVAAQNYGSKQQILMWLFFGLIPLLFYGGRVFFQDLRMMIPLCGGITIALFLFPTSHFAFRLLHALVGIGYTISSSYIAKHVVLKRDSSFRPELGLGIFAVMSLLINGLGNATWNSFFAILLIVLIALYFVAYYVEQYTSFLESNKESAGIIGANDMLRLAFKPVALFVIICLPLLFVISHIELLSNLVPPLVNGIRRFFNMLFSFIVYKTPAPDYSQEDSSGGSFVDIVSQLQSTPLTTSAVSHILDKIPIIITVIVLTVVFIRILIWLIKFIKNKLANASKKTSVLVEENISDVREKCEIAQNTDWKERLTFFDRNPQKRIRQLYKKKILSAEGYQSNLLGTANIDLKLCTARESAKFLEQEEIAFLYEKARYSNEECNLDDVRQMKNLCK